MDESPIDSNSDPVELAHLEIVRKDFPRARFILESELSLHPDNAEAFALLNRVKADENVSGTNSYARFFDNSTFVWRTVVSLVISLGFIFAAVMICVEPIDAGLKHGFASGTTITMTRHHVQYHVSIFERFANAAVMAAFGVVALYFTYIYVFKRDRSKVQLDSDGFPI